jgi:putative transcriptional regulator
MEYNRITEVTKMIKVNLRMVMATRKINNVASLAKLSGVTDAPIAKLYKEIDVESLKLSTLIKLCDALDCKLSELLDYSPSERS